MSDAERIWREKSDEDLLDAAAELGQFTEEGQRTIRAELKRRGLEDPVEQAATLEGEAPADGTAEDQAEGQADAGGDAEDESVPGPACLRCMVGLRFMGTRDFHEGKHWGVLGELGHLFENSEAFDVYMCPRCGHVDLFADGVGEGSRPA